MKKLKALLAAMLLAAVGAVSAAAITEEYTGRQLIERGDSYTFDFDLWYANGGLVNDSAPGLTLTTDGQGAFGDWSSATLYVDFYSVDSEPDLASIDFDAWGFRFLGIPLWDTDVLTLSSFDVSRPAAGSPYFYFTYTLSAAQIAQLDAYGWGSIQIGATRTGGNDFDLTRVGLTVATGAVPEPGTLALLAGGLLGLAVSVRRRNARK